jgi:hypothetical protein
VAAHFSARSAVGVDYTEPVSEAAGLTGYLNGANALVRLDDQIVLGYRAHKSLKYPYFAPLAGPVSGASLTTESALPYPHHRGLWLGCEPLNGGDYWADNSLKQGQIVSQGVEVTQPSESLVVIRDRCEWVREGAASPFEDERTFAVFAPSERLRLLDIRLRLTAREDIEIKKAKHSFFALRVAPDLSPMYGGTLLNSAGGVGAKGTYGKTAHWCGYHGSRANLPDVVEGIAILDHPDNFGGDCRWFTRDYGHLSPSPFNFLDKPWRLPAGDTLELKYCIALHAGSPKQADLDGVYKQWIDRSGVFSR